MAKLSRDQVNIIIKNGQEKGLTGKDVLDGLVSRGHEIEGIDNTVARQQVTAEQGKKMEIEKTEKRNYFQRVWDQYVGASDEIQKTVVNAADEANRLVDTNAPLAGVKTAAAGIHVAAQVAKAALAPITELAAPYIEKAINSETGQKAINSKTGKAVINKVQDISVTYKDWAERHPDAAQLVGDAVDIGSLLLANKGAKDITKILQKDNLARSTVKNHVDSARQVLKQGTPEHIAELGGEVKLVSSMQNNIVMQLEAFAKEKGIKALSQYAKQVKALDPNVFSTVDDFAKATNDIVGKSIVGELKSVAETAGAATRTAIKNADEIGIVQKAKEILQRFPRALDRAKDASKAASERAVKIKNAEPAVADALRVNLDERIINTVIEADAPTVKAYKDVLAIAEESPKKIGMKKQPSVISGNLAAEQFDLINKQKQAVGKQIGEAVKKLSKTTEVEIEPSIQQMEEVLSSNGIKINRGDTGTSFDFAGTSFTPAERARIQDLYKFATEGGARLTPEQIYKKNQLFSKLQREAKFEGVGDIIVETADGKKNLFQVFRDIYSKTLDDVSPDDIRALNKEYAQLSALTDDIENSIFKTPNFEVVKSVDPAEFAKVNLRRIFGDAQSSPVFEGVADAMDAASRGLGYKGATPKAVAEFAQELRKLFPETVPKTGFSGGIRVGITDVIEGAMNVGAPNFADKQKALRKLLDSLLSE